MTDTVESTTDGDAGGDTDTIADIDHEAPEGAADPNAVWERGRDAATDDTSDDETNR